MPPLVPAALGRVVKSYYHVWVIVLESERLKMLRGLALGVGDIEFHDLFAFVIHRATCDPCPFSPLLSWPATVPPLEELAGRHARRRPACVTRANGSNEPVVCQQFSCESHLSPKNEKTDAGD